MSDTQPNIVSVQYLDPWAELPPSASYSGVQVTVASGGPTGSFLAACLFINGEAVFYGSGQSLTFVQILPDSPLSPGMQYWVHVQWLANGQKPQDADWSSVNNIASAPVLTTSLDVIAGRVAESKFTLIWRKPAGSSGPSGGYAQIFDKNGVVGSNSKLSPGASSASIPFPFDKTTSAPYTLFLQGVQSINSNRGSGGSSFQSPYSIGPCSTGFPVPVVAPSITSVTYDGVNVSATWSELTGLPSDVDISYELLLTCTSSGVATTAEFPATSAGGTAPLPMPGSLSEAYTVSARVNYGVIKGPSSTPVPVITGSVANIVQTTVPLTGIATLSWKDASGFNASSAAYTGYTETFNLTFSSGTPSPVTVNSGTSYALTAQLAANVSNAVCVYVTATSGTVTSTGPSSSLRKLGTTQPVLLTAEYDGSTVSLSWLAMDDRVREYTATLFINGVASIPTYSAPAGAASMTFTPTAIVSTYALTVSLQAILACDAGPGLPSSSMPVSFTPAYFLATTTTAPTAPFIYPVTALSALSQPPAGANIVLNLPAGNYVPTGKTFSAAASTYFALAANTGNIHYPYQLTIDSATWTISSGSIRSDVQTDYITFLEAAEGTAFFTPWGISVIQEAIARHMPQTFAETLYYNYGLDLATSVSNRYPHADLRPGMVLRVMPSDYIVVPGSDRDGNAMNYLNGYTNSAPIDYDIGSYTTGTNGVNWMVGFDAFLSQLVAGGALTVGPPPTTFAPNVGGIAEAADLYFLQQPFYRLFSPTTLLPPSLLTPTGPGATTPAPQFNLAAAASYTLLEATSNGASSNTNTYFRGRAVIKLCIRVTINGNEAVVPIGTTVANILERAGRVPPKSGLTLTDLSLERAIGQTDSFDNASCQAGRSYAMRFDYQALVAYGNGQSALDLPLLHGDILTFGA